MIIISISGLDGSGKSTQVDWLKNYLKEQGKRVYYFHAVEFGLANKLSNLIKKLFGAIHQTKQITKSRSVTKANKINILLRKFFLKIDLIRFKNLRKKLERENYDYILSDRYFYDTIANIQYLLEKSSSNPNWKLNFQNLIKPDLAVFLKVNPEIIMQRERIPDQGMEYLKRKNLLYAAIANHFCLTEIDGNGQPNVVFDEIKERLKKTTGQ